MKIAICLSGEVRTFADPLVREGFKLLEPLGADLFISAWEHKGVSFYTQRFCLADEKPALANLESDLRDNYSNFNIAALEIEDQNKWFDNLSDDLANYLTAERECASSAPQIYQIWKCNNLKKKKEFDTGNKYDIVIRARPDLLFLESFNFSNFVKNTIFHINFGVPGAYFPNRIYDILFYGGSEEMDKLCDAWPNYTSLLFNGYENGLNKKDACRLLYIESQKHGLSIDNMKRRIADVYRGETLEGFKAGLAGWGMQP